MANYSITPCSGSTPTIIDFGATTPIISKVYYIYFSGATSPGCFTINGTSVGVAVDGITGISNANDDCFACTNCPCHYVDVTIVQSELDAASGNTNPSLNGVVSVSYTRCDSNPDYKDYTVAGSYLDDLCLLKSQIYTGTNIIYYYQNDNLISSSYPYSGSSVFDTGSCCIDPTPTPTVTPTCTQTPTVTSSVTPTVTPTNTETPTVTPTPTNTETPTVTPTPTNTETPTLTPTNTETPTPTPTVTNTQTPTVTTTNTETPTVTPTNTLTPSVTPSNTSSPLPFDIYTFRECCNTTNIFRFSFVPGSMTVGQVFFVDNSLDFEGCAEVIPYEATGPIYLGASVTFIEQTSCEDAFCPPCPTPTPTPIVYCTNCFNYNVYNDNTFDVWVQYTDCLGNDETIFVPQQTTVGVCACEDTVIAPDLVYVTYAGTCPGTTPTPQPTQTNTPTPSVTPTFGWNYCPVEEYCLLTYFPETELYDGTYYSAGTYNSRAYYLGDFAYIYYGNLQWCLSETLGGSCILSGSYPYYGVCPDLCDDLFSSGACVTTTSTTNPCNIFDFEAYFDCDVSTTTTTTIPCSATSVNVTFSAYTTTTTTANPCIGVGGSITISGYTTTTTTAPTTTTTTTTRDIVVSGDVTYTLVQSVFVCPTQTYAFQECNTNSMYYLESSNAFVDVDIITNYAYDMTINGIQSCYTYMGLSTISPNATIGVVYGWHTDCSTCQNYPITPTPTNTPTVTKTPTSTNTPTVTKTPTPTKTPISTLNNTPTVTKTQTLTPTNTPTVTKTQTLTPTNTPTVTKTPTKTPTPTLTNTPTPTSGVNFLIQRCSGGTIVVASNPLNLPTTSLNLVSLTIDNTNPNYGCWQFLGRTSLPVVGGLKVRRGFYSTSCPNPSGNPNCI
jgi:hypothetical protein